MNIKKCLKILLITLLSLFVVYLIYAFTLEERVWMSIKIENYIPIFAKIERIYFSEKQANNFVKKLKENNNWRELPITERLHNKVCKYAIDEDMNIPEVSNGYWFVLDRHSEAKDKYNEDDIFNEGRHANNFTVAVFDTDEKILYIYELDT